MKLKSLLIAAAVCLSLFLPARPGFSQQLQPLQNDPPLVTQMLQEGWDKVAEGVLQRSVGGGGKVETFSYGEAGLRWAARKFEARLDHFQKEYASHPSEELARLIETLKTELIGVDQNIEDGVGQAELPTGEEMNACSISYDALAAADPLTGYQAPGTTATASASFSANCGQVGSSFAYAYARATLGTVTTVKFQEDPKYSGASVASAATASAPGNLDCSSEATARVSSSMLNIYYEVTDTNSLCPSAPATPTVSVNGPTNVWLDDYYTCETVTWTATPSGGTPGYSYAWYIGGVYQGAGASLSKTYCKTNKQVGVTVTATDSNGQTANGAFTTWIYYERSCSSSCGCLQSEIPDQSSVNMPQQPVCP